jgi:hypothetical protein
MSTGGDFFDRFGAIDLRLAFVGLFMVFMTGWHIQDGTLFPDAIFFGVVAVVSFWLSFVGLGGEEGFEMGEGE